MKIAFKEKSVLFLNYKTVPQGECFLFNNKLYLKTDILDMDDDWCSVRLSDGRMCSFSDDKVVSVVKARVILE